MNARTPNRTATIIPFPRRDAKSPARAGSAPDGATPRAFPRMDFGAGWYHQAAMDADKGPKR